MAIYPVANAGPFWAGGVATPFTVTFDDDNSEPVPLAGLTASALMRSRGVIGSQLLVTVIDDDLVTVSFPTSTILTAGLADVEITLTGGAYPVTAEPVEIVIETHDGWLSLRQARRDWSDAPDTDARLYRLLQSAKLSCLAYAPALAAAEPPSTDGGDWTEDPANPGYLLVPTGTPDPAPVAIPLSYLEAQLMQARNILNVSKTDPAQSADGSLFTIRPYPLDNFIKQLLRPKRGVPVVG